jgi:hypothetical protein
MCTYRRNLEEKDQGGDGRETKDSKERADI